ncbi:MAG TPA: carboxypeptidase regulatory-like domain-containing protein, partial [Gemmatimonadales bacterium]|nr:carboxypeptidase regulatory-like domain-containing protein [Gemmatimonadales bacterium]
MSKCHVVLRGAFLAACTCVVASAAWAQDLTGSVEGTVLSADDGRPIKDAVVGMFGLGRYTTSDTAGHFLLSGVRFGGQRVEVRAIGFQPIAHAVTVVPGEVARVELRLHPAVVNLPEVVVSSSREEQLASATPLSVGVIRGDEIRETRGHHPSELVNRTPGVYVSNFGGEG